MIIFDNPQVLGQLEKSVTSDLDKADFGIVKMDHNGTVLEYNQAQSRFSGISRENAIGHNCFFDIAPCTNSFMVFQRYVDNLSLDEFINYTFTLVMAPKSVLLRMIKDKNSQYLLIRPT